MLNSHWGGIFFGVIETVGVVNFHPWGSLGHGQQDIVRRSRSASAMNFMSLEYGSFAFLNSMAPCQLSPQVDGRFTWGICWPIAKSQRSVEKSCDLPSASIRRTLAWTTCHCELETRPEIMRASLDIKLWLWIGHLRHIFASFRPFVAQIPSKKCCKNKKTKVGQVGWLVSMFLERDSCIQRRTSWNIFIHRWHADPGFIKALPWGIPNIPYTHLLQILFGTLLPFGDLNGIAKFDRVRMYWRGQLKQLQPDKLRRHRCQRHSDWADGKFCSGWKTCKTCVPPGSELETGIVPLPVLCFVAAFLKHVQEVQCVHGIT